MTCYLSGGTSNSTHSHTLMELNPWFAVDLGVALEVAGVNLTNRADTLGK